MKEEFLIIRHSNLDDELLDVIIRLKQQHWAYSYESQKEWINNTIEADAIHLLLRVGERYVAYMSIRDIGITIDGNHITGKGLGNVCVDKDFQKYGYGKKLVEKANEIIREQDSIGILLCHTHLVPFYQRCGWIDVKYDNLEIDKKAFSDILMLFNYKLNHISCMSLDRNF